MTPTQQYAIDGDYDKLSEDDVNGICAILEGWSQHDGDKTWWRVDAERVTYTGKHPPDYLHDWSLTGPLQVKHKIVYEYHERELMWRAKGYEELLMCDWHHALQAAICHAVCAIWAEKQKEKEE